MSADGMNHDFRFDSVLFLMRSGKARQKELRMAFWESISPEDFSERWQPKSLIWRELWETWWAVRDSNPRHPACKAGALTN